MRRTLVALAGGVLVSGLLLFAPQGAPPAHAEPPPPGGDGFQWNYSEEASGFYQPPSDSTTGGGGEPDPNDWITLVEHDAPKYDCNEHHPGVPGCEPGNVYTGCPHEPEYYGFRAPVFAQYTYRYQYKHRDDESEWQIVETDGYRGECVETPEFVPDEEIRAEFRHELVRHVSEPELQNQPATAIVNLPTVVWATAEQGTLEEEFRDSVTIPPSPDTGRTQEMTGFIEAEADYRWTFDGGSPTNTGNHQLGREYNPGVDPRQPNDYYISGVFDTTGEHEIALNVHWEGTITVDPLGPEELLPVNFEDTETVTVQQGKQVLGNP